MTAEEFREARRKLGFSCVKMAAELGTTDRTIRRWQKGTRKVPGPAIVLIQHLLKTQENYTD